MLYNFCFWFIMFILYSIIGYVAEIINLTIMTRKPVWNRGFLIGPYLPIYGVGCIFMVFGLNKYGHDLFAIFIIAAFFCTLLEYFTSLIMEKIFKLRWWDYTDYFLNINGRVCAEGLIVFGVGGMAGVYVLAPLFDDYFNKISKKILYVLCIVLSCLYIFDKIYSGIYPNTGKNISFNTNMEGVINK